MALKERIAHLVAWVQGLKPVRVASYYARGRGPILASGLAYQALFAVFGALWVAFSIAGLVVSGNSGLQQAIIDWLDEAVPGLIATDDGTGERTGAVDPDVLTSGEAFSVSGVIALAVLLFTAIGWLGSARAAVREMFDLPPVGGNPVLLKLADLAAGLVFLTLIVLAAGLSVVGSGAAELVLGWIGLDEDSVFGFVATRTVTLVVAVIVYALALTGLYRLLARVHVPWRLLRTGVVIGAVGLAGLTVAGGFLLGGARNNPLIASFAVIAGLLIYYNFACQVILASAAWMAVGVEDRGVVLDEAVFEERLERARALVQEYDSEEEPEKRGLLARLFRRGPKPDDDGGRG